MADDEESRGALRTKQSKVPRFAQNDTLQGFFRCLLGTGLAAIPLFVVSGVRGIGAHRTWLPWVSVNHLHCITGLEEFDPALYYRLAKGN